MNLNKTFLFARKGMEQQVLERGGNRMKGKMSTEMGKIIIDIVKGKK